MLLYIYNILQLYKLRAKELSYNKFKNTFDCRHDPSLVRRNFYVCVTEGTKFRQMVMNIKIFM